MSSQSPTPSLSLSRDSQLAARATSVAGARPSAAVATVAAAGVASGAGATGGAGEVRAAQEAVAGVQAHRLHHRVGGGVRQLRAVLRQRRGRKPAGA